MADTIVVAPGELVSLRTLDAPMAPHYVCSNGNPMVCDRPSRTYYCYCLGSRKAR